MPQIGLKEERRVLLYASDGLKPKVRCLGKPLVKSREGGICALAVLTRIQAQRLVGLVHTQAAVEQRLDHRGDHQIEHKTIATVTTMPKICEMSSDTSPV